MNGRTRRCTERPRSRYGRCFVLFRPAAQRLALFVGASVSCVVRPLRTSCRLQRALVCGSDSEFHCCSSHSFFRPSQLRPGDTLAFSSPRRCSLLSPTFASFRLSDAAAWQFVVLACCCFCPPCLSLPTSSGEDHICSDEKDAA